MKDNILIGRRAVYTQITRQYDEKAHAMVEDKRETFTGTIAALVVAGEYHYPKVVLLYDDGTLRDHALDTVTLEAEQTEGPYR